MLHNFGKRINLIRKREHLTREQMANKITDSAKNIERYEKETNLPSVEFVERFCSTMNVSPTWLIMGNGSININTNDFNHSEDIKKLVSLLKYAPSEFINNVIEKLENFKENSKL